MARNLISKTWIRSKVANSPLFTAAEPGFMKIAGSFSLFLFGPGSLVIFATALTAGRCDFQLGARLFCLGFLLAGASTVCGWLLGLLFGIPRTLARPQPIPSPTGSVPAPGASGTASPGGPASRVNTNLEDVSDWLSKTIVGVGLTQLTTFPSFLWKIARALNDQGFGWVGHGQLYGLLLLLYFVPGGFWLSYVTTRTTLTRLFDQYADPDAIERALQPDQLNLNVAGKAITPASDPDVEAADRALLPLRLANLGSTREIAAWAVAKARSGDLTAAVTGLREAVQTDPGNTLYRDALAKVLLASGDQAAASQVLDQSALTETNVLAALYDTPPNGYERAIDIGEAMLRDPTQNRNYRLRVWLACAYGQKHGDLIKQPNRDEKAIENARNCCVDLIEQALTINSTIKSWLRSLWKPASNSLDDDFKSIPDDDPDFKRLLD